jgi:hypothetical protein
MAKAKANKSFKDWEAEEVELTFGINRLHSMPFIDSLKNIKLPENHPNKAILEDYRLEAFDLVDSWNEDEYKFMFISPFFKLVNLKSANYKVFTQRPMSVKYNNDQKTSDGLVEFMLAKGRQIPRKPHFFLHEYKPEKRRDNDPLGQLLIAMVAAQKLNLDDKPIYGIYVNGRNWFFVALEANQYAVSNPYVITTEDIFDLYAVLLYFKQLMDELYQTI